MFKNFKLTNIVILIIGICYIYLAFSMAKTPDVEESFEECEGCKDAVLHIVIPTNPDVEPNIVHLDDYRKGKDHEPA